jgi:hypothetical protein
MMSGKFLEESKGSQVCIVDIGWALGIAWALDPDIFSTGKNVVGIFLNHEIGLEEALQY